MNLARMTRWNEKSTAQKIMFVFGVLMVFFYFAIGIYVMVAEQFNYISQNMRFGFGFFFIAYGFFRLVRIYSKFRNSYEE